MDALALVARGRQIATDGAGIIDVGGESTRPGAEPVSVEDELARVLPVIRALAGTSETPISIDTMKSRVAEAAIRVGATIVNDVSGLRDEDLASVAARHRVSLVLTHNGHTTRQRGIADSGDPVEDVVLEIQRLAEIAQRAGVAPSMLIADPGLGFGKPASASLALIARTSELRERLKPFPLLVGPSRKSFVGQTLELPVDERLEGTLACVAIVAFQGAELIRVHDVRPSVRVARMTAALREAARATA